MTRSMGDAIHVNVGALHAAGTDMVAGYVTGTPDIQWTAVDWLMFPVPKVTIDQGYQSPAITTATVRDVEQGAWSVGSAVDLRFWAAGGGSTRPTIYCSASTLPALEAAGWRGDVWVAAWGAKPTGPYPVPAGMTCVAVQYTDQGGGGAYDLSVVFDDSWPGGDPMSIPVVTSQQGFGVCDKCGCMIFRNLAGRPCPAGGTHDAPADYYDYSQQFIHVINGVAQ